MTSRIGGVDDLNLKNVLDNLLHWQRRCLVLLDEVYVNASITYHGRTVFGKAADDSQKLAETW